MVSVGEGGAPLRGGTSEGREKRRTSEGRPEGDTSGEGQGRIGEGDGHVR